jgi:hypothetical protein
VKLADLRRLAIREKSRIRFTLGNGMECVVTEQGIARVPELKSVPGFNLEQEAAAAVEFLLEPAPDARGRQTAPRRVDREELTRLAGSPAAAAHEDE